MLCNKCLVEKGMAGQGFTKYTCDHCGEEFWHHNTNVPIYCPECAQRLGVCEQCGKLLPNVERHDCGNCEHYNFEEDWDGNVEQWCTKGHEDVDSIWNQNGLVCKDFKKNLTIS